MYYSLRILWQDPDTSFDRWRLISPSWIQKWWANTLSLSLPLMLPKFVWIDHIYNAQDVYRIGTLMELVRVIALSFADDGKRVKVCCFWHWLVATKQYLSHLNPLFSLEGLCPRIYGGRCTCRNAIAACWYSTDLRVHGLGWLWCNRYLYQYWIYR